MPAQSLIKLIESSLKQNWEINALTDYDGPTLQYSEVARKVEKFHLVFKTVGIKKGDRIAICGKNSVNWCLSFIATVTYGAVAVPIQREFKADDVQNVVRHSESRLIIISPHLWQDMQGSELPDLIGAVSIYDLSLLYGRDYSLAQALAHQDEMFDTKFSHSFSQDDVCYDEEQPSDMALINYTSGTTGFSKGVMLNYASLLSNVNYLHRKLPMRNGDNMVSMLPLGHVFGMTCDFLSGFTAGVHLWFLTRQPSPKVITSLLATIHPRIICSVPLVVEKIFKKLVLPQFDNQGTDLLISQTNMSDDIRHKALNEAMKCFGDNLYSIIIGGAPLNADIEAFMRRIGFPYTCAYGLTETAPLIAHENPGENACQSCGKAVDGIVVKVNRPNAEGVGELVCRGTNLMMGYYKNPEATAQTIDSDGWLHTGDMATIDEAGNIFIKGRCKNMLLGSAGENIYPEEIESRLNNMPYVGESLVIKKDDRLVALIYPDMTQFSAETSKEEIESRLKVVISDVNKELPNFSQLSRSIVWPEPFEKTAKKSIKRYLYTQQ